MANNATLNFFADNKEGHAVPVNAKIYVGDYQARATQIADTNPTTQPRHGRHDGNLDNTAQFVPERRARWPAKPALEFYNFTAVAPGFGMVRFNVRDLQPGEVRNITIHFAAQLRLVDADGDDHGGRPARDEHQPRQPARRQRGHEQQPELHGPARTSGRPLGRDQARRRHPNGNVIKRLGVSALLSNRFAALRSFDAYSCRAGKDKGNPTCDGSIDAGWTKIVSSPADAFPSVNPRPVTPDMTLRYFDVSVAKSPRTSSSS